MVYFPFVLFILRIYILAPYPFPKKARRKVTACLFESRTGKVKLLRVTGHSIWLFQPHPYFLNLSQVIRSVILSTSAFPCVPCMPPAYMRRYGNVRVMRLQIAHHNAHRFAIRLTFARSRTACVPCMLCFDRIARNNDYVTRLRIRCHNAHRFALLRYSHRCHYAAQRQAAYCVSRD